MGQLCFSAMYVYWTLGQYVARVFFMFFFRYKYNLGLAFHTAYSCIFHPCNFDRIAFSTPAFSVAPRASVACSSSSASHAVTRRGTLLNDEESAWDSHVFACNFAKYSPIFIARCYASAVLAMGLCLCPCLCLSVTSRSSTKTDKRRITQKTHAIVQGL